MNMNAVPAELIGILMASTIPDDDKGRINTYFANLTTPGGRTSCARSAAAATGRTRSGSV
jgi:hypothetical protein